MEGDYSFLKYMNRLLPVKIVYRLIVCYDSIIVVPLIFLSFKN